MSPAESLQMCLFMCVSAAGSSNLGDSNTTKAGVAPAVDQKLHWGHIITAPAA